MGELDNNIYIPVRSVKCASGDLNVYVLFKNVDLSAKTYSNFRLVNISDIVYGNDDINEVHKFSATDVEIELSVIDNNSEQSIQFTDSIYRLFLEHSAIVTININNKYYNRFAVDKESVEVSYSDNIISFNAVMGYIEDSELTLEQINDLRLREFSKQKSLLFHLYQFNDNVPTLLTSYSRNVNYVSVKRFLEYMINNQIYNANYYDTNFTVDFKIDIEAELENNSIFNSRNTDMIDNLYVSLPNISRTHTSNLNKKTIISNILRSLGANAFFTPKNTMQIISLEDTLKNEYYINEDMILDISSIVKYKNKYIKYNDQPCTIEGELSNDLLAEWARYFSWYYYPSRPINEELEKGKENIIDINICWGHDYNYSNWAAAKFGYYDTDTYKMYASNHKSVQFMKNGILYNPKNDKTFMFKTDGSKIIFGAGYNNIAHWGYSIARRLYLEKNYGYAVKINGVFGIDILSESLFNTTIRMFMNSSKKYFIQSVKVNVVDNTTEFVIFEYK